MANSPARSGVDVGSVIADTYTVEALIGRGGMGAVFVASHARLPGKKVAIKILHPDLADSESLVRFRREAEIASRLGHPNIVDVLDWNALPDGTPYLVLEYLHGEPLSSRVARGPMPLEQVFLITRQVGSALAAAHAQDIIHRDLKPQNVFLVPTEGDDFNTERAKVLDFGISKIRGSTTVKTQDTAILGTPQYMAPEQATGNHAAVDGRTDVFALGAMVYEMISGVGAFAGNSIPEVVFKVVYEEPTPLAERVPSVPPHVAAAVHKALAKKQDERFPSVAAFVEALTGQPLQTARRGAVVAPSDGATPSMRTKQADALAATMGSGDHARELGTAATIAPTAVRAAASGLGGAAAGRAAAGAGSVGAGATVPVAVSPAALTNPTLSKPPKSKTGLVLGLAAIVVAGAVAVTLVVTQGKKGDSGGGGASGASGVASGSQIASASGAASGAQGASAATSGSATSGSATTTAGTTTPGTGPGAASGSAGAGSATAGAGSPGTGPNGSGSGAAIAGSGSAIATAGSGSAVATAGSGSAIATAGSGSAVAIAGSGSATAGSGSAARSPHDHAHGGHAGSGSGSAAGSGSGAGSASDSGGVALTDAATPGADDLIAKAEAADAGGDPDAALRLANKVTGQDPTNPRAWALKAKVFCAQQDREKALAALRHLDGRPAVRRRTLEVCKRLGLTLE